MGGTFTKVYVILVSMIARSFLKRLVSRHTASLGFFLVPLSLIFFVDSTLSFVFPIYIEEALGSNMLLGLVMAASSLIGIGCDLIFPQLLARTSWRQQLLLGIMISFTFPFLAVIGKITAFVAIFLLASMLWGVYYEFLSFAQQNFVTSEESRKEYAGVWGVLYASGQFTGIVGPILGSFLLQTSHTTLLWTVVFLQACALFFSFGLRAHAHHTFKHHSVHQQKLFSFRELWKVMKYWRVLAIHLFPAIVMGVWLEAIEATYWTLGGLFGKELTENANFQWLPVVLYSAPFIIGSLLLTRFNIESGKKHLSHVTLICAGVFLTPLVLAKESQIITSLLILISSFALSFAGPLQEAVYSDVLTRAGEYKQDLLGLAKANSSIAYILFPVLVGYSADVFGYVTTFSLLGVASIGIGALLFVCSPKKLAFPHAELQAIR